MLFDGGKPCDVKGAFGVGFEEIPKLAAVKDTQPHMGAGLNRMAHFTHDTRLQANEITGKNETDDLTIAVFQRLVADAHTRKCGIKLGCVRSFQ